MLNYMKKNRAIVAGAVIGIIWVITTLLPDYTNLFNY